jgi:molybdopterin converting factor small subunit
MAFESRLNGWPMVRVHFTAHLRHVAPEGAVDAKGATVAIALADVFARHPAVKGYVLDDQDRLRTHIAVFVDGTHVRKDILSYPLRDDSELYVLQALSGG